MERLLVAVDGSANGAFAADLAGIFSGGQRLATTVLEISGSGKETAGQGSPGVNRVKKTIAASTERASAADDRREVASLTVDELVQGKLADNPDAIENEAAKGYSVVLVGLERPIATATHRFAFPLERLIEAFEGPIAIALNGSAWTDLQAPLDILVPTGGAAHAHLATELALAFAKATQGNLTALHVFDPREDTELLRGRLRRGLGVSVLQDVQRLGKRGGVPVEALTATNARPELAIRRVVASRKFDLIVLGVSLRLGERKFLGPGSAALVQAIKTPLLLIAQ
jgi:nucleotide-binding universal stress UspA family protein